MKKALTLAEVLVTMAIIGIVAAITLPSLINNYQQKVYKETWKKAYSEISGIALQMSYDYEVVLLKISLRLKKAKIPIYLNSKFLKIYSVNTSKIQK